ncbi:hypothetical protein G9A89_000214, partial [Geosiphon pyriformis]
PGQSVQQGHPSITRSPISGGSLRVAGVNTYHKQGGSEYCGLGWLYGQESRIIANKRITCEVYNRYRQTITGQAKILPHDIKK